MNIELGDGTTLDLLLNPERLDGIPPRARVRQLTDACIKTTSGKEVALIDNARLEVDSNGHPFRVCGSIAATNYEDALSLCDLISGADFYDGNAMLSGRSDDGLDLSCVSVVYWKVASSTTRLPKLKRIAIFSCGSFLGGPQDRQPMHMLGDFL